MAKTLTVPQATRIEGNAQIRIFLTDSDAVEHAHFEVMDFRGFERFLVGCDVFSVPYIGARVCGICSAAHELAAVKALEAALGIQVNETITNIREIMLLGLLIKSHALNLCFMVLPDFFGPDTFDIFDMLETQPWLGRLALQLRSNGEQIENAVGGRNIHSAGILIGGLLDTLVDDIEHIRTLAQECLSGALEMNAFLWGAIHQNIENFPVVNANTMTALWAQEPDFYRGDTIILRSHDGGEITRFQGGDYKAHLTELTVPWTYSKFPYITSLNWPEGILTSGPLPRLLALGTLHTPKAAQRLPDLVNSATKNPNNPLLNDLARALEMIYAAERILELLDEPATKGTDVHTRFEPCKERRVGTGILEAPRGTLIHRYEIENMHVKHAELLVPTQQNNAVINSMIETIARDHVVNGELTETGRKRIGIAIRALDPCLSCAAHTLGSKTFIQVTKVQRAEHCFI